MLNVLSLGFGANSKSARCFLNDDPQVKAEVPGRIAAVDFGTVRMGIAITDPQQKIASPLEQYVRRGQSRDSQYFIELADREGIVLWVVGLPVHLSGQESQKSTEVRKFGEWLTATTGVRVTFFDERFSTQFADEVLMQGAASKKKRKQKRDKIAAQIILTAYLEAGSGDPPLPLDDGGDA